MITYDFQWAKQAILSNVWTDSNFTWFYFWLTFYMNWHIMTTYDFLSAKQMILSNVWTDFNLNQFRFW